MGISQIDIKLCSGCGICVNECPMDVIRMDEKTKKAFVKYVRDCQACYMCQKDCPEEAIEISPFYERRMPLAW